LGEHQEDTHARFVYDTTLTVPLIFRCPGRVPAGRRVAAQVRLVDIAPTILALLGLPALRRQFAEFLLAHQRPAEALREYQELVQVAPEDARAFGGLGLAYNATGKPEEAITSLRQAAKLDPELPQTWQALGEVLTAQRRYPEALEALRTGHQMAPERPAIAKALAWLLATCPIDALRDGAEALRLARKLERATAGRHANVLDTLAAALAEQGRFSEAVETIDRAINLGEVVGKDGVAKELKQRRDLYAANRPYRLPPAP
jgi:tetratricopeptide (TPR) repeat protein